MARYVFVADPSLSREYNNVPLMDFLPSAPTKIVPGAVYAFLKGRRTPDVNGRAVLAPYALRKLEAALLARNRREDVVIAHEDFAADFIKDDTEIIGVYTMDPLGLGPLTMSFSLLFGGRTKAWVRVEFERLIRKLSMAKRGKKAKLVVGGPGVWELTMMPGVMEELGIDYAFQGGRTTSSTRSWRRSQPGRSTTRDTSRDTSSSTAASTRPGSRTTDS
jgi:radical SAM superfamily enzyme YgiQ (UPF0313 family)